MNRAADTSVFKYIAAGLLSGILYMLVKSVKTSLSDIATLADTAVYLLPYLFMSICVPMTVTGAVTFFAGRRRVMLLEYLSMLVFFIVSAILITLSPDRTMLTPRIVTVIVGLFMTSSLFTVFDRK